MGSGRGGHRDEKGATLVEFVFVLPFLALMLFGLIDFGFLFSSNLEVRSASREGARLAAVDDSCANNSCGLSDSGQQFAIIKATRDRASGLAKASDITVRIWCNVSDCKNASVDGTSSVTVCLSYTFQSVTGIMQPFIGGTVLKSSATMRLEQKPTFLQTDVGPVTC